MHFLSTTHRSIFAATGVALFWLTLGCLQTFAQPLPEKLQEVGVEEKLGSEIKVSELEFKDETGKSVRLEEYFSKGRPVLITPVYYQCPNLCNLILNGLVKSLKDFEWIPGEQFEIVTFSINPKETVELAAKKKAAYMKEYGKAVVEKGWHFLTGDEAQIQKLASQIGFKYRWDAEEKQYAHTAASPVLTPTGKISRYLYGIDFPHKDLKLALLEASNGKIGTVVDRILLFCFRYDPLTRKYSIYLTRLMQWGCGGTVLFFGSYLFVFWRRQRKEA